MFSLLIKSLFIHLNQKQIKRKREKERKRRSEWYQIDKERVKKKKKTCLYNNREPCFFLSFYFIFAPTFLFFLSLVIYYAFKGWSDVYRGEEGFDERKDMLFEFTTPFVAPKTAVDVRELLIYFWSNWFSFINDWCSSLAVSTLDIIPFIILLFIVSW